MILVLAGVSVALTWHRRCCYPERGGSSDGIPRRSIQWHAAERTTSGGEMAHDGGTTVVANNRWYSDPTGSGGDGESSPEDRPTERNRDGGREISDLGDFGWCPLFWDWEVVECESGYGANWWRQTSWPWHSSSESGRATAAAIEEGGEGSVSCCCETN